MVNVPTERGLNHWEGRKEGGKEEKEEREKEKGIKRKISNNP